jgi:hypothetical protein
MVVHKLLYNRCLRPVNAPQCVATRLKSFNMTMKPQTNPQNHLIHSAQPSAAVYKTGWMLLSGYSTLVPAAATTTAEPVRNVIADMARPLPLAAVRLTGDGKNLTGHIDGHDLSALSMMWASTGDNLRRVTIMWDPLVLAGDIGPDDIFQPWQEGAIPALVTAERPPQDWLKPVSGLPGHFNSGGSGNGKEVEFMPFFYLHRRAYAVYFDLFTSSEWEQKKAEYAAARERQHKLERATVAFAQPGEMQPERDFNFQSDGAEFAEGFRIQGRAFHRTKNWMSFTMPVDANKPMVLVVTYFQDQWRKRTFDILLDSLKVAEQVVDRGGEPRFFDVQYTIPKILGKNKKNRHRVFPGHERQRKSGNLCRIHDQGRNPALIEVVS